MMNTKPFLQAFDRKPMDHTPVWLMRQAGRYLPEYRQVRAQAGGFLDLCYTPDLASEVTLQPLRRFDLDAAIIFSDILVVPHALGQNVWFAEGEGPRLNPIKTLSDLPGFSKSDFLSHLGPVFEAVSKTRAALNPSKALIGFAGAPWTLACYMIEGKGSRDFQSVRLHALHNPQDFQALLNHLADVIALYLIEKIKAGAEAIQIFDSWSGVLSVEEFDAYCIQPTAKIVKTIKQTFPDVPIIGFPRAAGFGYQSYVENTGINGVSCDASIPLDVMKDLQKTVTVQGNLDNILLLKGGVEMDRQAQKICETLGGGSFIFNLGHGVIKETDPQNVERLIEVIRSTATRKAA